MVLQRPKRKQLCFRPIERLAQSVDGERVADAYGPGVGVAAVEAAFRNQVADIEELERRAALIENLVLCQLLAWRELEVRRPEISYWRTAAGEEVDFVIEWQNRVVPIEVKSGTQPRLRDARNLEAFVSEYQEQCRFGVILFDGNEPRLLTKTIAALPLAWFA